MRKEYITLFDLLDGYDCCIIGSALRDYRTAKDVDVLFLNETDFLAACKAFHVRYNGWDTPRGHVRRANISPRHIGKKVQFIHVDTIANRKDHPYASLGRDGSERHRDTFFEKPYGWAYT